MRILITGGSGFIGSQLALHARVRGIEIVVAGLCNSPAEVRRIAELESAGISVARGALQDAEFLSAVVRGCDAVIHLAAAQHEANVPDSYFHEVNVEGTRALLEASCRAGVERFVYGGTIGVYGSCEGHAADETTATRPDNIYSKTKLAAERVVASFADRMATTIIRISETYGPGDERLLKLFRAIDRGVFMMIGEGANLRQPIHVHDLVRGLLLAAEHPSARNETFVFAGREAISTCSMVEQIAAALTRSPSEFRAPLWLFSAAATVAETICKPLHIQPPLHHRRLDFFVKSFRFSTAKAKSLLGFEAAIPFDAGCRDTAAYYRNRGWLGRSATVAEKELGGHAGAEVPLETFADATSLQHRDILEYTHDAILIWEMDGAGIRYWNRAAEQLYGYDRRDALGRVTHVLLKTHLEGGIDHLERSLTRYGVWAGVLHHQASDGSPIIVEARLALMAQRNGKWLVLEINKDVTAAHPEARRPVIPVTNAG